MARCLALLVMLLALSFPEIARCQQPDDEKAIRGVVQQMTDAFNNHDAKAALSMYTEDADFVSVRGEAEHGAAHAEQGLTRIFATRAKNATLRTLDVQVRFVRPDVALVHVRNELNGLVTPDGKPLPSHEELSLRVFVKNDEGWRVTAFQNTLVSPFDASSTR